MPALHFHATLPASAAREALLAAGFIAGPRRVISRTLLDTFDGRLHGAGIEVEFDGASLVVRQAGSPPASVASARQPRFAGDLPAGPLRARLASLLEMRALLARVTVSTTETVLQRRNRDAKVVAAVTLSEHPLPGVSWACEVADMHGHERQAAEAGTTLAALGATSADGSLPAHAAALTGVDLRGVDCSPTVPLDSASAAIDGFAAVFTRLEECIDINWDGTIEQIDTEFLHDLRVAVRRTRSVLSLGRDVLPDAVRADFGDDFRWFGGITGRPRDLDVYLLEWPGYEAELSDATRAALAPVHAHIEHHCSLAHGRLVGAMESRRAAGVRSRWRQWLADPAPGERGRDRLGDVVAERLRKAQGALIQQGRAITDDSPAEMLHDLRKRAKKLRYLIECFGGLLSPDRRKAFVKTLKGLQDNLGEHQDTQIHADELRSVAHELEGAPTDTILALGQLRERLEMRRAAARHEFSGRFAAYDTAKTRGLVRQLGEDMRR